MLALLSILPSAAGAPTPDAVVETVNAIRSAGCAQYPALDAALHAQPRLDAVALQMMQGQPLAESMERSAYRATAASSLRIRIRDGASLQELLGQRFCEQLTDAAFEEIGVANSGRELWIVLAAPFSPPAPGDADAVRQQVLARVNHARLQGQRCGRKRFDSAAPLARSAALERAAIIHAGYLAAIGELTHRARDGGRSSDRVTREGYAWSAVAENLAAGATTAEQVVNGWLSSPSHCANLMNPRFTDMGLAYVTETADTYGIYWVQVLGAPRRAF